MKWISVDEQLPERNKSVLAWGEGDVHLAYLRPGARLFWDCDTYTLTSVTHWMPLPEPPES